MKLDSLLLISLVVSSAHSFSPSHIHSSRRNTNAARATGTQRSMIDPTAFPLDVGIAAVSAAAGAFSQVPKIQQLERELDLTREALTDSEQEMVSKIHELEEKLFTMDREYEGQTDKFKKQYDLKMRDNLAQMTEKIKIDYGYQLEIRVEEAKSKLLQDKFMQISNVGGDRQAELVKLRLQRSRIEDANKTLEKALGDSKAELDRLQEAASKKAGWWPF